MAPMYTIVNKSAKYSTWSIKRRILPNKNTKIRIKIEWIGFCTPITRILPPNKKAVTI